MKMDNHIDSHTFHSDFLVRESFKDISQMKNWFDREKETTICCGHLYVICMSQHPPSRMLNSIYPYFRKYIESREGETETETETEIVTEG